MLSKAKIKWIHSLEQKKFRLESGLFLAEGDKLVADLLPCLPCCFLAATDEWLDAHGQLLQRCRPAETQQATRDEIQRASLLQNPQHVLAAFEMPRAEVSAEVLNHSLSLALDNVQDPGNLGTIVRMADWFGIGQVLCSKGTADIFAPKAVQASMGALARVKVLYTDLEPLLASLKVPVFGTFLEGEDIYRADLPSNGIILMGNEGKGVSPALAALVSRKLFIPNYPAGRACCESLNVSAATAVVCSEFRRRSLQGL